MSQRTTLSLKEKMEIIKAQEVEKTSVREIARRFNIGKTQAATILKDKSKIQSMLESGDWNINVKRQYLNGKGRKLDVLCYEWFSKAQSESHIIISGPEIKAKAKEIASSLGIPNFTASNGWLYKWRTRHNISLKNLSGIPDDDDRDSPLLIPKCEAIITVDDSVEFENPSVNIINSDESALNIILRLKQYLKDDYIAFGHLNNLESYLQSCIAANQTITSD
ncbi:tigger transposable element-derived protein 6-like [Drosophila sulfurigaster albostrigata]|uniref:tigger transposable element-derived protein 6-like n=1 Tax=Drosophila sulfurigaster albostrigata TaxID=89887 RepID=UPI002D21C82F|nr:tigger transposable element-derived protein 6-like [Drosophila sulfurigaster albostrigata]